MYIHTVSSLYIDFIYAVAPLFLWRLDAPGNKGVVLFFNEEHDPEQHTMKGATQH